MLLPKPPFTALHAIACCLQQLARLGGAPAPVPECSPAVQASMFACSDIESNVMYAMVLERHAFETIDVFSPLEPERHPCLQQRTAPASVT